MKEQKILVTGSGGFLMGNLIRRSIFNKLNYSFLSIDKVQRNNVLNNVYRNKDHKFFIGDISDEHFIDVIFESERPDIVIHGAATKSYKIIKDNVLGTHIIAEAAKRWGSKQLVYISTDQVYDSSALPEGGFLETTPTAAPKSPYAASKLAGELMLQSNPKSDLKVNIIRLCNVFGPRQDPTQLLPTILRKILAEEQVPLYGLGQQIRQWIHAFDACDAIMKVVSDGDEGIYNVSAGQELTNLEIFQEVSNLLGKGSSLPYMTASHDTRNDIRQKMNTDKIKALGWERQLKFKEGLESSVQWYIANQWAIKDTAP